MTEVEPIAVKVAFEVVVLDEDGRHTMVQPEFISGNRALGNESIDFKDNVEVAYAGVTLPVAKILSRWKAWRNAALLPSLERQTSWGGINPFWANEKRWQGALPRRVLRHTRLKGIKTPERPLNTKARTTFVLVEAVNSTP